MHLFKYYLVIIWAFVGFYLQANAQKTEKIYQLSGLVLSKGASLPISYARLVIKNKNRFGICNEEGFFSIAVTPGDTIMFSRVGHKRNELIVSQYLKSYKGDTAGSPYLYAIQYMDDDTLTLPTVTIYPYKNSTDLKYAILNMDRAPLGFSEAQTSVSPELMAYFMENLPENEEDRINVARRRYMEFYSRSNYLPKIDPVAIYNLIRYVSKKKEERKERNLKYINE